MNQCAWCSLPVSTRAVAIALGASLALNAVTAWIMVTSECTWVDSSSPAIVIPLGDTENTSNK